MRSASEYLKMALAILLVLTSASVCVLRLMKVQVVNSDAYHKNEVVTSSYTQKIAPTRGEIVDAAGLTIVSNHVSYAVVIDEKNFPSDNAAGNAILLRLTEILEEAGVTWEDSLSISRRTPYAFDSDTEESRLKVMKRKIGVNAYATAQNCMDVLCETYGIRENLTPSQKRTIAGIRYTMLDDDFSISNRFQLANNLPMDTVTKLSELAPQMQGVLIEQTAARRIEVGDVIPHEIGTTGPIYAENAQEYLDKGYDLNAIVGISGLERAMEEELQGKAGVRTITYENGIAVSDEITEPVDAGHTIRLTVNAEFQRGKFTSIMGTTPQTFTPLFSSSIRMPEERRLSSPLNLLIISPFTRSFSEASSNISVPSSCAKTPPRSISPTSNTFESASSAIPILTISFSFKLISAGLPAPSITIISTSSESF